MTEFTDQQKAVLKAVQQSIPIVDRPFRELEKDTGISETEIIDTIRQLKENGIIRNISGIFNAGSLGYHLSLVAFRVPEANIEQAAAFISSHPGVSHNYLRDHSYNIWFTLAEENKDDFLRSMKVLEKKTGATGSLILRNEKLFKIRVRFNMDEDVSSGNADSNYINSYNGALTEDEKATIAILQKDLPLTERPFETLSNDSGFIYNKFLKTAGELQSKGVMRRFSAILNHRKAGYSFNAMTAWKLPENRAVEKIASAFAAKTAVTHLYLRTIYPGEWEHPLFAMIHARSEEELSNIVDSLSKETGLEDKLVLHSLREFKKQRVIYFSPDFKEWKKKNYD